MQPTGQRLGQLLVKIALHLRICVTDDIGGRLGGDGDAQSGVAGGGNDAATPFLGGLVDQSGEVGNPLGGGIATDRAHRLLPVGAVDPTDHQMRHHQPTEQDQNHLANQGAGQQAVHDWLTFTANM